MKAYLRRVAINCTALFLLVVLLAPAISASDGLTSGPAPQPSQPTKVVPKMPVYEPPDLEEPAQVDPSLEGQEGAETEEIPADMPEEEVDPDYPDLAEPDTIQKNGKSNPQGQGLLKNLFKRIK
ncbi:MAG: hypothetical protein JSV09_04360 [Thermoplasmata archaeon]|nr:MAG: hypothetical protein JSV09_04360 [Thermoplasmata archaeon]